jgi:glycosyltransferase involved in cell wall biosynthesis
MTRKAFLTATKLFRWMNNEQQCLVILTPGFPASESDTTCLPMQQDFIRTLMKLYPKLRIIVLSFQYPYEKKTYQWFGVTVISFNGRNKGGWQRLLLRREIMGKLQDVHQENRISGLLSFWYGECAVIGKRFGERYGIRHCCWILGQDARKENVYPRRVPAKAGELVALSDFLQDEFEKNHGTKPFAVIPPGIDHTKFHTSSAGKDIDLLAAGSLIPLKQFDIFIEIVAAIKKDIPGIMAVLAGDGPQKDALGDLIGKKGLEKDIMLTGELPHHEMLQLMQRTKLLLHPSSYEGFSGVCLEALSAGAHVISFCQPMRQPIPHWHIVNTKEEMEKKAIWILSDQGTEYERVNFPMETTVQNMMDLLQLIEH